MKITINDGAMTISMDLKESKITETTCEEAIIATLDILSRIYDDKTVIDAYYNVNPDTLNLREEDDALLNLYKKYELDVNEHIQEKE